MIFKRNNYCEMFWVIKVLNCAFVFRNLVLNFFDKYLGIRSKILLIFLGIGILINFGE